MKINRTLLLTLLGLIILGAFACQTRRIVTRMEKKQTYGVSIGTQPFDAISAASNFAVNYTIGEPVSLTITTTDTNYGKLEIHRRGTTLILGVKAGQSLDGPVEANLTAPAATCYQAQGNAGIYLQSPLTADKLHVTTQNNALVKFKKLDARHISINSENNSVVSATHATLGDLAVGARNNSVVTMDGTAATIYIDASNNACVQLTRLSTATARVTAYNNAVVYCNAASLDHQRHNNAVIRNK